MSFSFIYLRTSSLLPIFLPLDKACEPLWCEGIFTSHCYRLLLLILKVRASSQKATHLLITCDIPKKLSAAMKNFGRFDPVQTSSATHVGIWAPCFSTLAELFHAPSTPLAEIKVFGRICFDPVWKNHDTSLGITSLSIPKAFSSGSGNEPAMHHAFQLEPIHLRKVTKWMEIYSSSNECAWPNVTPRVMMRRWGFIGFRQFVRKASRDYLEIVSNCSPFMFHHNVVVLKKNSHWLQEQIIFKGIETFASIGNMVRICSLFICCVK